jgi:hypothetical protein
MYNALQSLSSRVVFVGLVGSAAVSLLFIFL